MQRWAVLGCVVTILCAAGLLYTHVSAVGDTTHTVTIDGVAFTPATITVKTGETVMWVNKDPFPHTVTSPTGEFDSQEIAADESWSYRPTKAGVFAYNCRLHPTMHATLKVE